MLLLRSADGEGLGVLPITASILQRVLRPAAQSILQPRCVIAQLSARIQDPGMAHRDKCKASCVLLSICSIYPETLNALQGLTASCQPR